MADFETFKTHDARLVVLKELNLQSDGSLNDSLIREVLDAFGHRRSRDWIQTQLRAMAELGAVRLNEAGSVMIASITRAGIDHVERRAIIEGIAKPSPEV